MTLRSATSQRWSHTHHHSDTVIVGLDPEIVARPPVWRALLIEIMKLTTGTKILKHTLLHCIGKLNENEKRYLPASALRQTFWEARIQVFLLLGVIAWCISIKSIMPLLFVGLPGFYGFPLLLLFTLPQHFGLSEDVVDHRLNTRTYYTNPIFRFLYMNMNYHIEHHMFPMVPYHALPDLHEEMKADCPPAAPSLWAALKESLSVISKQRKDITYCIIPPLPGTAQPYWFGPKVKEEV